MPQPTFYNDVTPLSIPGDSAQTTALANGGFAGIWQTPNDEDHFNLVIGVFDARGELWASTTIVVGTDFTAVNIEQTIAALPGGGFAVAWSDPFTVNATTTMHVAMFDASGVQVGTTTNISVGQSLQDFWLTALDNGGVVLTWDTWNASPAGVHAQIVAANGSLVGSPFSFGSGLNDGLALVTELSNGNLVFGYADDGGGFKTVLTDSTGAVIAGSETNTAPIHSGNQLLDLAALPGGGFIAVYWDATFSPLARDVRFQKFDADGDAVGSSVLVSNGAVKSALDTFPSIVVLDDGRFFITWEEANPSPPDVAHNKNVLMGELFTSAGAAVGSAFVIGGDGAANVASTTVDEMADGRIVVSWTEAGSGYFRIIDPRSEALVFTGDDGSQDVIGTSLADTIDGAGGSDTIEGSGGADSLSGGDGNDFIFTYNTSFDDSIAINDGANTADGGAGADLIRGSGSAETLLGGEGDDSIGGRGGADSIDGGAGNDAAIITRTNLSSSYSFDVEAAQTGVTDTDGTYFVSIESVSFTGGGGAENVGGAALADFLHGGGGDDTLGGRGGADFLQGDAGADTLDGGSGNDSMVGGAGDDVYAVDSTTDIVFENINEGVDTVNSSAGFFQLPENVENLYLSEGAQNGNGNQLDNSMSGNDSSNSLDGAGGMDSIVGGGGADVIAGGQDSDWLSGDAGDDTLIGDGHIGPATIVRIDDASEFTAGSGQITFDNNGVNPIYTVNVASLGDVTVTTNGWFVGQAGGAVHPGVFTLTDHTPTTGSPLALDPSSAMVFITTDSEISTSPVLTGSPIYNGPISVLFSQPVAGVGLTGGEFDAANSAYIEAFDANGNSLGVVTNSGPGEEFFGLTTSNGAATIAGISFYVNADEAGSFAIDNLTFAAADTIAAYGADFLDGGEGADTMTGGNGNDFYVVDNAGDVIVENADEGVDQVFSSLANYTLAANADFLFLDYINGGDLNGTGNELDNLVHGNNQHNVLDGGAGNDFIDGDGTDLIGASDTIHGGEGDDQLDGWGGADQVFGDAGDDRIQAYAGEFVAGESADGGAGIDTLIGSGLSTASLDTVDFSIGTLTGFEKIAFGNTYDGQIGIIISAAQATGSFIAATEVTGSSNSDTLTINGATALNLSAWTFTNWTGGADLVQINGTSAANTITGSSVDDRIDGGAGADAMAGGAGNDAYLVDVAGDTITEGVGAGVDTVLSLISYTLGANVDNLVITGVGGLSGTGNNLANSLIGNSGGNTLDGKAGADTLMGGAGNDIYYIDNGGDVVTENASEGTDTVRSTVGIAALAANVENLEMLGTAGLATGNELNNRITGNASANSINGGLGNDTMLGGAGNDTYFVDSASDVVTEVAGEGTDAIFSTVDITLLAANVENLTLSGTTALIATGNSGNNSITGNAQNNTLNGGAGEDSLAGGFGNDTYVVNSAGDVVTEAASAGFDTIVSSISVATLAANVDNLTLTGSALIGGGNELANVIIGNALGNTLTGGLGGDQLNGAGGADTMSGGAGDDSYLVENVGDVVNEVSGEGFDTIYAFVSISSLAANVEKLTLMPAGGTIDGTANNLDNRLNGNDSANVLTALDGADVINGLGGNDRIIGGAGLDNITGGAGNDVFVYQAVSDSGLTGATRDLINDFVQGADTIDLSAIDAVTGGSDNAFTMIGAGAFTHVAGQLRYDLIDAAGTANDYTVIGMDVNGDGAADSQITLKGLFTLTASDFVL